MPKGEWQSGEKEVVLRGEEGITLFLDARLFSKLPGTVYIFNSLFALKNTFFTLPTGVIVSYKSGGFFLKKKNLKGQI